MLSAAPASRGRRLEWPTLALIAVTYAGWAAAGAWLWPVRPVLGLVAMTILAALHTSLVHEAVHGHPTRQRGFNEALMFWPLALVWPYRRFRALHLRHHRDDRLTDARDDPESGYLTPERYAAYRAPMRALLVASKTMVGAMVIGPVLAGAGLVAGDARRVRAGESGVAGAWGLHALGLAGVLTVVVAGFGIPAWLYALTVAWGALAIVSIRSFAEHRWRERPEERTVIVERSPLSLVFLNNNLHLVHHANPGVPWYALPALYRARRGEWGRMNGGYVYPGYGALLRAHAFRPKEPLVHPALAAREAMR